MIDERYGVVAQFNPKGGPLLTATIDGSQTTINLWDPKNGMRLISLHRISGPGDRGYAIASFTPDGAYVVGMHKDPGVLRVWDVSGIEAPVAPTAVNPVMQTHRRTAKSGADAPQHNRRLATLEQPEQPEQFVICLLGLGPVVRPGQVVLASR